MKILLAIHSLFALLIAIVMIFLPDFFLGEISGNASAAVLTNATARSFGFAVLAMAGLSLLMMFRPLTPEVRFAGLGTLAIFHLGMTISQGINVVKGLAPVPLAAVHAVFFLLFFATFVWSSDRKKKGS